MHFLDFRPFSLRKAVPVLRIALIIQAMLGIFPYAPAKLLLLDPHLPEWLPEITLERLRVGEATINLSFTRTAEGETEFEIRISAAPCTLCGNPALGLSPALGPSGAKMFLRALFLITTANKARARCLSPRAPCY
jgi:hypothetical protein